MSSTKHTASHLVSYTFDLSAHDESGRLGRFNVDVAGFRIDGAVVSPGIAEAVLAKLNEAVALIAAEHHANACTIVELARYRTTREP